MSSTLRFNNTSETSCSCLFGSCPTTQLTRPSMEKNPPKEKSECNSPTHGLVHCHLGALRLHMGVGHRSSSSFPGAGGRPPCIETRHVNAFLKAQPNKTNRNDGPESRR